MDEDLIVREIIKSLAFEIEAVNKDNVLKWTTTNGTPLSVKVRVRNKNEPRLVQRGAIPMPRIGITAPDKLRLASSDQTILSFNVYLEHELEKQEDAKRGFRMFNIGGCLGTYSDDDAPYLPGSSNQNAVEATHSSKSDSDILSEKVAQILGTSNTTQRNQKSFFGKCKPGGCLDPPFGEDKYPYGLPKTDKQDKLEYELRKFEDNRASRQSYKPGGCLDPPFAEDKYAYVPAKKDLSQISEMEDLTTQKISNTCAESNKIPEKRDSAHRPSVHKSTTNDVDPKQFTDIYARRSRQNSIVSKYSNSIITYATDKSSTETVNGRIPSKIISIKSYDEEYQSQNHDYPESYFVPPKDVKRRKIKDNNNADKNLKATYSAKISDDQQKESSLNQKISSSENDEKNKNVKDRHTYYSTENLNKHTLGIPNKQNNENEEMILPSTDTIHTSRGSIITAHDMEFDNLTHVVDDNYVTADLDSNVKENHDTSDITKNKKTKDEIKNIPTQDTKDSYLTKVNRQNETSSQQTVPKNSSNSKFISKDDHHINPYDQNYNTLIESRRPEIQISIIPIITTTTIIMSDKSQNEPNVVKENGSKEICLQKSNVCTIEKRHKEDRTLSPRRISSSENEEFDISSAHSVDSINGITIDRKTKIQVKILQNDEPNVSTLKWNATDDSGVIQHVPHKNDNVQLDPQSQIKRTSAILTKTPFIPRHQSDLHDNDAHKTTPLKRNTFKIIESDTSLQKGEEIEEIPENITNVKTIDRPRSVFPDQTRNKHILDTINNLPENKIHASSGVDSSHKNIQEIASDFHLKATDISSTKPPYHSRIKKEDINNRDQEQTNKMITDLGADSIHKLIPENLKNVCPINNQSERLDSIIKKPGDTGIESSKKPMPRNLNDISSDFSGESKSVLITKSLDRPNVLDINVKDMKTINSLQTPIHENTNDLHFKITHDSKSAVSEQHSGKPAPLNKGDKEPESEMYNYLHMEFDGSSTDRTFNPSLENVNNRSLGKITYNDSAINSSFKPIQENVFDLNIKTTDSGKSALPTQYSNRSDTLGKDNKDLVKTTYEDSNKDTSYKPKIAEISESALLNPYHHKTDILGKDNKDKVKKTYKDLYADTSAIPKTTDFDVSALPTQRGNKTETSCNYNKNLVKTIYEDAYTDTLTDIDKSALPTQYCDNTDTLRKDNKDTKKTTFEDSYSATSEKPITTDIIKSAPPTQYRDNTETLRKDNKDTVNTTYEDSYTVTSNEIGKSDLPTRYRDKIDTLGKDNKDTVKTTYEDSCADTLAKPKITDFDKSALPTQYCDKTKTSREDNKDLIKITYQDSYIDTSTEPKRAALPIQYRDNTEILKKDNKDTEKTTCEDLYTDTSDKPKTTGLGKSALSTQYDDRTGILGKDNKDWIKTTYEDSYTDTSTEPKTTDIDQCVLPTQQRDKTETLVKDNIDLVKKIYGDLSTETLIKPKSTDSGESALSPQYGVKTETSGKDIDKKIYGDLSTETSIKPKTTDSSESALPTQYGVKTEPLGKDMDKKNYGDLIMETSIKPKTTDSDIYALPTQYHGKIDTLGNDIKVMVNTTYGGSNTDTSIKPISENIPDLIPKITDSEKSVYTTQIPEKIENLGADHKKINKPMQNQTNIHTNSEINKKSIQERESDLHSKDDIHHELVTAGNKSDTAKTMKMYDASGLDSFSKSFPDSNSNIFMTDNRKSMFPVDKPAKVDILTTENKEFKKIAEAALDNNVDNSKESAERYDTDNKDKFGPKLPKIDGLEVVNNNNLEPKNEMRYKKSQVDPSAIILLQNTRDLNFKTADEDKYVSTRETDDYPGLLHTDNNQLVAKTHRDTTLGTMPKSNKTNYISTFNESNSDIPNVYIANNQELKELNKKFKVLPLSEATDIEEIKTPKALAHDSVNDDSKIQEKTECVSDHNSLINELTSEVLSNISEGVEGERGFSKQNIRPPASIANDIDFLKYDIEAHNDDEMINNKSTNASSYGVPRNTFNTTKSTFERGTGGKINNKIITGASIKDTAYSSDPLTKIPASTNEFNTRSSLIGNRDGSLKSYRRPILTKQKDIEQRHSRTNKTKRDKTDSASSKKYKNPVLLDMTFYSYTNDKNERVIQTHTPQQQRQQKDDTVNVVKTVLHQGSQIRVPVDKENDLAFNILKKNERTRKRGSVIGSPTNSTRREKHVIDRTKKHNEVLNRNLVTIYESELVPLHNVIKDLTQEVNLLTLKQEMLQEKMRNAKRTKSLKFIPVKKCVCRRI